MARSDRAPARQIHQRRSRSTRDLHGSTGDRARREQLRVPRTCGTCRRVAVPAHDAALAHASTLAGVQAAREGQRGRRDTRRSQARNDPRGGSPRLVDLRRKLELAHSLRHANVLRMVWVDVDVIEEGLWIGKELMDRGLADVLGVIGEDVADSGGPVAVLEKMIARSVWYVSGVDQVRVPLLTEWTGDSGTVVHP